MFPLACVDPRTCHVTPLQGQGASPTFLGDMPKGPTFGASTEEGACSPPYCLRNTTWNHWKNAGRSTVWSLGSLMILAPLLESPIFVGKIWMKINKRLEKISTKMKRMNMLQTKDMKLLLYLRSRILSVPIGSMAYGMFTYMNGLICMVNVGKQTWIPN